MSIKLRTASDGLVILQPEDTASEVTVTVPAGTSDLVSTDTLRTELNATGTAPIYACRAWCNFDGSTIPPTIRASGNVSSVTRNSSGDYTVNFTTALPDVNYCSVGGPMGALSSRFCFLTGSDDAPTTTSLRFLSLQTNSPSNPQEPNQLNIAIFR